MLSEFRLGITNFIKSKNISNAAWSSIEAVIYPALMLVATPIFIQKLGVELYGIWMLVNTIVASIGILNIGLGDATIKFVSKNLALKDKDGVIKIISATYSLYLILAILVMAIGFVFAFLLKNFNLFHVSEAYMSVTCHTIQIAGITLGLKFIEQIFLAVFKGYQRYDLAAKVSIIGKIITILVNLLLVYLG